MRVYFHTILSFVFAFDEALLISWAIDDYRSIGPRYQAYQVRFESILAEDVEPQRRHLRRFGLSFARRWPAHLPQGVELRGQQNCGKKMVKGGCWGASGYRSGGRLLCFSFMLSFELFDCCFLFSFVVIMVGSMRVGFC